MSCRRGGNMKPTEHQIQTAIIQYLRHKGFYVQRMNSGKYAMGEGRSRRFIHGVDAGTPDIMAFKETWIGPKEAQMKAVDLLFIEVKRPGNKPTALQKAKMEELEEHGAKCYVATSVEDIQALGI